MLPVNCGSHADYQNLVVENLRKYYPNPDLLARSTWDIIERFWHLDLSDTDTLLTHKYSKFGPVMLSRLVDTFFSRTSWTMLLYAENHSISVA